MEETDDRLVTEFRRWIARSSPPPAIVPVPANRRLRCLSMLIHEDMRRNEKSDEFDDEGEACGFSIGKMPPIDGLCG